MIGIDLHIALCLSAIFTGFYNVISTNFHDGLQRWTEGAEGYGPAYRILLLICKRILHGVAGKTRRKW
jgi:hypothetical protein